MGGIVDARPMPRGPTEPCSNVEGGAAHLLRAGGAMPEAALRMPQTCEKGAIIRPQAY